MGVARHCQIEKGMERSRNRSERTALLHNGSQRDRKAGKVESFDGLDARLLAELEIKIHSSKRQPYTENGVQRQNRYVYDRGKNVYELLSPEGKIYVMQGYSREVDKELNEAALVNLADRLKLPHAWKYRTRMLDEAPVIQNVGGKAYVIQDELKNTYQLKP